MAVTEFGSASAQAVKRWSAELAHEAIGQTWFKRLLGEGQDACIMHLKDLERAAGDQIKFDVRYQDRSAGVQGDAKLEGFESALEFYQDTINIDQLRQAHAFRGMTQQRTVHDLRREGRKSLADWFSRVFDGLMMSYLAGIAGTGRENVSNILGGSGFAGNALQTPDTAHLIDVDADFTLPLLDQAIAKAKTINPRIRPIMVDGQPKYVAILHPYAVFQMKTQSSGNNWNIIHQRASERSGSNPIYTGALGEYNGVVIHESEYIPVSVGTAEGDGSGDVHNLFLGAGAGAFAMGSAWDKQSSGGTYFKYVEDKRDYDNEKGIAGSACFGIKKCRFNSTDFGVIRIDTQDTSS